MRTHVFVDGAYLRHVGKEAGKAFPDPYHLAVDFLLRAGEVHWGQAHARITVFDLTRLIYYDARPEEGTEEDPSVAAYWKAVELLPDTELGFGALRGRKPMRQKGVDTLMASNMIVGALTGRFECAGLIAGDADFVPVVREIRRHGVRVLLAAQESSLADDLKVEVDRFVTFSPGLNLHTLDIDGNERHADPS